MEELTPKQIVEELDKYIIGQDEAKKSVAIALRNRWRRRRVDESIRDEIMPANIIMIGPTGVGKTEVARRLARLAQAPFVKVEASKFTEIGYVGRDVDSMVRDLVDLAITMEKERSFAEVETRARERATDRILEILLPSASARAEAPDDDAEERRRRTKDKLRSKLESGALDAREVTIEVQDRANPFIEVFSNAGLEEMGIKFPPGLDTMLPRRTKGRSVTVEEARKILAQEEKERLVDMDKLVARAIKAAEETGIIFIDEIDKIASRGTTHGPDVSREGVQRDILPIVEGSSVTTKHGVVKTDHMLFIAAGAFHMTKPSDLIPELQGRFPIRVEFKALTAGDFERILLEPRNALLKQYTAIIETENCTVTFTKEAVREIARMAFLVNQKMENIGARRLHTVLTTLLEDYLFELPSEKLKKISITGEVVRKKLEAIIHDEDLARYIL
ncbi:MAG: ATP-dependent protease ATPase subunit HslU [Candidatus Krumholzibacteriaceae bacterium]|jgi:ATP-dependent HslUV protease ATP-binding subunit HslU